jgi:hypothetical protein
MNSKIVGVANGTRNNRMNQSISTWAIPFTEIKLKEYKSNDRAILAKLAEIKTLYASDEIMEEEVMPDSTAFYKAVQSSKKYPTFIFGLRWSRPAHFQSDGVLISTHLNDLNANLDISLDKQVYKFFYLGCYISSKYLQYKVLNKFNYDLPLLSDTYVVNHQKWLDTYGFQASIIPFRGVLWQTSLGLGGFYAGNGERLNNYRAYATYTHYLFHSQRLALQAKGLYLVQNEQILISTLGNARFSVQSLKQYFLCFGISYSFQKRK